MTVACAVALLFLLIISYLQNKRLNSPLLFLNSLFVIILFGASLGLFGMNTQNDEASILLIVGMLFVNIGYYTVNAIIVKNRHSYKPSCIQFDESSTINTFILTSMLIIIVYFSIYYILQTIQLFAKGYSLNMVRLFYFNHDLMEQSAGIEVNGLIGYGTAYLYTPIQHVYFALTSLIWFDREFLKEFRFWRKLIPFVSVLNIIIAMLTNGGRLVVYYLLICVIMTALSRKGVNERKHGITYKKGNKKRRLIIFASICIIGYFAYQVSLTRADNTTAFNIIKTVYIYFCGCIPNLQIKLNSVDAPQYAYGVSLVSGFIRPFFTGLRFLLHIPIPEVFSIGDGYLSAASATDIIGAGITYNAFVTMFYFFYRDLGLLGLIVESYLAGCFFSWIYNCGGRSTKGFIIYLLLMQGISIAFIRWQIMSVGYAISYYYALLLFTTNRSRLSNTKNRIKD